MAARQTYYAESLAEQTNTTVTYSSAVTLTFTPDASSTYLIIASANVGNKTILTRAVNVRLRNNTTGTDRANANPQMKDLTDREAFFSVWVETFGSSPASQTYEIGWAAATAADNCVINEARLFAIKLTASDASVVDDSNSTTTATTFSDKATLTFTPASSGDYLIIAAAQGQSSNGDEAEIKLVTPSGDLCDAVRATKGNTAYYSWGTMVKQTLAASSQTFKFQFRNNKTAGGDTVTMRTARVVALRLDQFDASYYAESRAVSTTTVSASYQDKATLTQTPAALEHVILFCGLVSSNSASVSSMLQGVEASTAIGLTVHETFNSNVDSKYPWLSVRRATLAASSTTWKVQYKSSTGTATTISIWDAAIAVLQTGSGGAISVNVTMTGMTASVGTVTVVGNASTTISGAIGMTASVGTVTQKTNISPAITGAVGMTASVGTVTVVGKASTTISGAVGMTLSGGAVTVVGKAIVTLTGAVGMTASVGTVTVVGKASTTISGAVGMTASGGTVTVVGRANVNVTETGMTASVGTVTVNNGASATVTGQSVPASVGSVTVVGKANVTVLGQSVPVSVGSVTVNTGFKVDVVGEVLTMSVGAVSVSAGGSVSVGVTGQEVVVNVGYVTVSVPSTYMHPVFGGQSRIFGGRVL